MKLFLDTANLDEVRRAVSWGVIDGVTTNPRLVAREGQEFKSILLRLCEAVDGPVCAEVLADDLEGLLNEAREVASWHPRLVVKLVMSEPALQALQVLRDEGIRTEMTLLFSPNQALLAAKAGADYASLYVGRLDDAGHEGMEVVRETVEIIDRYGLNTEVIVASIRHPQHVTGAALAGAHIATVPFPVLQALIHHPLTEIGQQRFFADRKRTKRG